jgi:hypothetical protein
MKMWYPSCNGIASNPLPQSHGLITIIASLHLFCAGITDAIVAPDLDHALAAVALLADAVALYLMIECHLIGIIHPFPVSVVVVIVCRHVILPE